MPWRSTLTLPRLLGKHQCLADAFRVLDLNVNQKIGPQDHVTNKKRATQICNRWRTIPSLMLCIIHNYHVLSCVIEVYSETNKFWSPTSISLIFNLYKLPEVQPETLLPFKQKKTQNANPGVGCHVSRLGTGHLPRGQFHERFCGIRWLEINLISMVLKHVETDLILSWSFMLTSQLKFYPPKNDKRLPFPAMGIDVPPSRRW